MAAADFASFGSMSLSPSAKVWNRAALEQGGSNARNGDRALSALLRVHGMIMNGGLGHAFDVLSEDDLNHGKNGYLYFGFPQVSQLLEIAKPMDEEDREDLGSDYAEFIPSDNSLFEAFEKAFRGTPEDFAPLI